MKAFIIAAALLSATPSFASPDDSLKEAAIQSLANLHCGTNFPNSEIQGYVKEAAAGLKVSYADAARLVLIWQVNVYNIFQENKAMPTFCETTIKIMAERRSL